MLAVVVEISVKPETWSSFMPLMLENAGQSLQLEEGCKQFDVCIAQDREPRDILLYELYDDRAAFDTHLATDHFQSFDRATKDMITAKQMRMFTVS